MSRKSCSLCRTIPHDILTLECQHTLCISCANRIRNTKISIVTCPTCRYQTYLDGDIIEYLEQKDLSSEAASKLGYYQDCTQQSLYENKHDNHINVHLHNTGQKATSKMTKQRSKQSKRQANDPNTIDSNKVGDTSLICKKHPQYQMMYVCFNCNYEFICPQCAIHGCHKSHEVQSIKKFVLAIQSQLSSKVYSLNCSIEGLVRASDDKKIKLKQQIQNINKLKHDAVEKYQRIKAQLAKEESQILQKCNNLVNCFSNSYEQVQSWIDEDLLTIEKEKNLIASILTPSSDFMKRETNGNKITQLKIANQYLKYLKAKDNCKDTKYMWINKNKDTVSVGSQESQRSLVALTDRIQRISICAHDQGQNQIETNPPSLMNSKRTSTLIEKLSNDIQQTATRKPESPFNILKISQGKENIGCETQSIVIKASRMRGSRKSTKNAKTQQQFNFLIF